MKTMRTSFATLALLAPLGLAACGSSTTATAAPSTSLTPTRAATSSAIPSSPTLSSPTASSTSGPGPVYTPSAGATFTSYVNERFRYSIDYPTGWSQEAPAVDGDGTMWTSPDGASTEQIYGDINPNKETPKSGLATCVSTAQQQGSTVTLQTSDATSYTCSGTTSAAKVFYDHVVIEPDLEVVLQWLYPVSAKPTLDAYVTATVSSEHVPTSS